MKKLCIIFVIFIVALSFSACRNNNLQADDPEIEHYPDATLSDDTGVSLQARTNLDGDFELCDDEGIAYLTLNDVKSVQAQLSEQNEEVKYSIKIDFTEEGRDELAKATEKLVGKNIKIKVDDDIVYSVLVKEPNTTGVFVTSPIYNSDQADEILDKIEKKD